MELLYLFFAIITLICIYISYYLCCYRENINYTSEKFFGENIGAFSSARKFTYRAIIPLKDLQLVSVYTPAPPNIVLENMFIYKPSFLTPVGNQKACGACWAFVITGMLSDIIRIHMGNFTKCLAIKQLMYCFEKKDVCEEGASPEQALLWMEGGTDMNQKHYVGVISCDKYTGPNSVDRAKCYNVDTSNGFTILNGSVKSLNNFIEKECIIDPQGDILATINANIYNMKVELITNGPFFAGIYAYDDLFTFTGDSVYIKTDNSSLVGGHAVEIVGWVDKGVDTRSGFSEYGYWVCKNSWGTTDWCPEYDFKGYFPIRMGTNECHIESSIIIILFLNPIFFICASISLK